MEFLKFGKNSNDIMKFDFEENRHIAEHTHPDIEILYLLEGTVSVTISHNTYQMEKTILSQSVRINLTVFMLQKAFCSVSFTLIIANSKNILIQTTIICVVTL